MQVEVLFSRKPGHQATHAMSDKHNVLVLVQNLKFLPQQTGAYRRFRCLKMLKPAVETRIVEERNIVARFEYEPRVIVPCPVPGPSQTVDKYN